MICAEEYTTLYTPVRPIICAEENTTLYTPVKHIYDLCRGIHYLCEINVKQTFQESEQKLDVNYFFFIYIKCIKIVRIKTF